MTMTRMLDQLDAPKWAAPAAAPSLIGSSLGGTLAILAAARFGARVDRLVLLAPAVMFGDRRPSSPAARADRASGSSAATIEFFHYGYGGRMRSRFRTRSTRIR